MAANYLESYLVRLGADVDAKSWGKFQKVLTVSAKQVEAFAGEGGSIGLIATAMIKAEAFAVSSMITIGGAIMGVADKTAIADQNYRLLGMRMMMGTKQARAMSQALSTLGVSLDQVMYDPELAERFKDLYERNISLGGKLGDTFSRNMYMIRGMKTEAEQFRNEIGYLAGATISNLFEGVNGENSLGQLRKFNDYVVANIPMWSQIISTNLIPALKDFEFSLKDVKDTGLLVTGMFQTLIGFLSGDTTLEHEKVSLDSLTKSFSHVSDGLYWTISEFDMFAKEVTRALTSVIDLSIAAWDLQPWKLAQTHGASFTEGIDAIKDAFKNGIQSNLDGLGHLLPRSFLESHSEDWANLYKERDALGAARAQRDNGSASNIASTISSASSRNGIDPLFVSSVMQSESSSDKKTPDSKTGAVGLMQIEPYTAARYGVSADQLRDPNTNIQLGTKILSEYLRSHKYDALGALISYNSGRSGDVIPINTNPKAGGPDSVLKYVNRSLEGYASRLSANGGGNIHVGSIQVTITKDMSEGQAKALILDALQRAGALKNFPNYYPHSSILARGVASSGTR